MSFNPATKFAELKAKWKSQVMFDSNVTNICMNMNYQHIIGMGPVAVPLIMADLEDNGPDHWYWALFAIVGEDHAAGEETMRGARDKWLAWYAEQLS